MEIRILGDFEFARQIISGVARMFSLGEGLGVASGILLVLYLIWTFIKHALDPEKSQHPAKEFVFGIILWMALGASGTSAKFDVTLTSVSDPSRFEAINDVPALAAIPAWLATNFFQIAREKMEDTFSPASYTLTDRHLDPLSALLQVYDNLPDIGLLNVNPNTDLNRSVRAYMQFCYLADHNLDGAPPESPRAELDKTDIAEALLVWQRVKVTYNFLTTPSYMNSATFGQNMSCEAAWTAINTHLDSAEVRTRISQYYNNKGVSTEAITHAGSMLAGAYSGGIDSYKLQLGLLSSYMIRDGIAGTAMENERDKMIFEAWRKRVVEKGGEATIFKKLMVPMITAIEMFSFFIAPLMMVMAIMGGMGFSYIGKYLMLVLFINLWGFVKVFVDLYTAISVERAFEASAIAPFSFGQYANTFMEIEGFLSTAAALTTAIPMFATFLLYGGVHSVMGVMRAMSGGAGVDASNMAPTTASSMNGGVRTMGDQTSTYTVGTGTVAQAQSVSENQLYGSTSVSDIAGMGQQATASLANSAVSSSANAVVQSLNDYFAQQNLSGVTNSDSLIKNWSSMSTEQRIEGLAQAMESAGVMSAAEARQALMQIGAGADISLDGKAGAYGLSAALGVDARAAINASGSQTSQETLSKAEKFLENFQQNYSQTEQGGDTAQNGRLFSDAINFSNGTQGGTVTSRLNDFKTATSEQANFTNGASQINSIADSQKINHAAVGSLLKSNGDDAMRIYENMKRDHGDALRASGMYYENTAEFFSNVGNGDYYKAFMNMNKELANFDSKSQSVAEQAADMRASGALMQNLSQLPADGYVTEGFKTAAASYNSQADALERVDAVNKSIGAVDNTKLSGPNLDAERARQEAAESEAMAGREDIQKVREEGIASMPSVAPRAPQDTVTGRAEAALQEQKELHGDGKLFKAGQELAAGMVKGVDNLIDFFKGPSQLWGQDGKADGERFQAALTGSDGGFYSLALGKGFEGLASKDLPMMRNNDFVTGSDGSPIKAKSDAYAMNDTIMALKSAYGQDFYKQIPDDENGKRFKEGIDNFMQLKSQLPVEEQQKMDAISAARLSGDLPSAAAERLIANNLKPEGSQLSQHDGNYFLFRNNDELKDNMPLLKMAGYAAQGENGWERKLPAPVAGTGAMNHAYNMIKQDEMARLSGNGAFIDGSGGFVTNVNRDYKDERVVKATEQLLDQAIKIDTTARLPEKYDESEHANYFIRSSNATASDGGYGVAQPFILGIANSGGLDSFADRLARSGFERNAQNVRDFGNALVSNANENGLIVTPEQRTQARERADELVIGNQAGNSQTTETAPKQVNSGEPNSTNAPVPQNADGNNGLGLPYKPQQAMDLEAAGVRYFAMPLEEQRYLGGPAVQDPVQPNSNAAPQPVTPAAATAAQPATAQTTEPGTATQATAMQTAEPAPTPVTGIDTMGAAPAPQQAANAAPATLDPVQPNANATQQPVTAAAAVTAAQSATAQTTEPGTVTQATAMQAAEPTPVTGTDTMGAAPAPQQVATTAPATLDPVQPNSNATQQPVTAAAAVTAAQSATAQTTEPGTVTQATAMQAAEPAPTPVTGTDTMGAAPAPQQVANAAPATLDPVQPNSNATQQPVTAAAAVTAAQSATAQTTEPGTATQATAIQAAEPAPTPVTGTDTMGAAPAPQQVANAAPATLDPVQPNSNATQQPVTAAAAAQSATAQTTEPGTTVQPTATQTADTATTPVTGNDTMGAAPAPQQVANAAPATLDPVQPNANATQQPVTAAAAVTAAQSATAQTTEPGTATQATAMQAAEPAPVTGNDTMGAAPAPQQVATTAPATLDPVQPNANGAPQPVTPAAATAAQSATAQTAEPGTATQATAMQTAEPAPTPVTGTDTMGAAPAPQQVANAAPATLDPVQPNSNATQQPVTPAAATAAQSATAQTAESGATTQATAMQAAEPAPVTGNDTMGAAPAPQQVATTAPATLDPVQPNGNATQQPVTPAAATAAQPATAQTTEPGTATQATAMQTAEPAPTPVTGTDTMGAAPAPQQVANVAPATLDPVQLNANGAPQPVTPAAATAAQTTEPGTTDQPTATQTADTATTPVTGNDTTGAAPAQQQAVNAAPATLDPVQPNSNATQQPVTTASEVTAAQSTTAETNETATGTQAGVTQATDSPTATASESVSNVAPAKLEPVQSNGNVDEQARMAATDQFTTTQPIESVTATQATAEQPVDAAPVTSVLSDQSEIKGSVAAGATGEATTVTGQNAISSTNDVIASNTPAVKKDSNERVANVESSQQVTALAGNSQSAIYTEQTVSTQDSVAMKPEAGSSVDSVAAGAQGEVIQSGSVSAAPETMVNDNATSATTSASDSDFIPVSSASASSVAVEAAPVVAESGGNPVNLPDQDSTMFTDMNGNALANGSAITIDNVDYVVSGTHNDGENTYQVLAMADDRDQTFTFQYGRVTPFSKD